MLRMRQIQGCVNFVQNIHWGWLELKEGHDEWKSNQRSILYSESIRFIFFLSFLKLNSHLCPQLNSVKLCFHTGPSWTLTSRPSIRSWPSGGWSFAKLPGRSSAKISPKSLKKGFSYHWATMKAQHNLLVNLCPRRLECISFVSIDWFDCLIDFHLVLFDNRNVLFQIGFLLFNPCKIRSEYQTLPKNK